MLLLPMSIYEFYSILKKIDRWSNSSKIIIDDDDDDDEKNKKIMAETALSLQYPF